MTTLLEQTEVKIHTVDNKPLVGATYKHPNNNYHYEIFVQVPVDHDKPNASYETIDDKRYLKIASMGRFDTQGLAMEAMKLKLNEFQQQVIKRDEQ